MKTMTTIGPTASAAAGEAERRPLRGSAAPRRVRRSPAVSPPLLLLLIIYVASSPTGRSAAAAAAGVGECELRPDGTEVCPSASSSSSSSSSAADTASDDDADAQACTDGHDLCAFWAEEGECSANPNYMLRNCRRACKVCGRAPVPRSRVPNKEKEMLLRLVAEYGEPQEARGSEESATLHVVKQTVSYMKNFVFNPKPTHTMSKDVAKSCKNRDGRCSFWAAIGECEANPAYMATKCAPSCRSCHKIDFATRCPPRGEDAVPGLRPGDLNALFERIVATAPGNRTGDGAGGAAPTLGGDGAPAYTVTVHSRPAPMPESERVVSLQRDREQPPWVITFDDFLTEEECEGLIELGRREGYKRSRDVGAKNFDGSFDGKESVGRTSENAWCSDKGGCRDDPLARRVLERMANVTGIPAVNFEDMQLLRYEVGQFYKTHHDYIPHQRDRQCGPRILTFFLYLSDVEAGGGTNFPDLEPPITVYPKRGRALLWPSVYDSDPSAKDVRTMHRALPVEEGTKFASNAWIHLYDYLSAQRKGCN